MSAETAVPEVAVRSARMSDLDSIAAIERESFTLPWSRRSFADLVNAPGVVFLVAGATSDSVAGYAVLLIAADHCELANLAVAPPVRGRGIGRRLLSESIAQARERQLSRMFLEVRESNRAAQSLYASAGFRSVARRKHYYERPLEDALLLRLDL
jgi:ribosomal-protein-alanine N-acetyltransferase